jgi:hypothetical protein
MWVEDYRHLQRVLARKAGESNLVTTSVALLPRRPSLRQPIPEAERRSLTSQDGQAYLMKSIFSRRRSYRLEDDDVRR